MGDEAFGGSDLVRRRKGPRGHVDAGLGKGIPLFGAQGLIAPTVELETTGTELAVDGVPALTAGSCDRSNDLSTSISQ